MSPSAPRRRAQRVAFNSFGLPETAAPAAAAAAPAAAGSSDTERAKARAARFGLPENGSAAASSNANDGLAAQPAAKRQKIAGGAAAPVLSAEEKEKLDKRAKKFGLPGASAARSCPAYATHLIVAACSRFGSRFLCVRSCCCGRCAVGPGGGSASRRPLRPLWRPCRGRRCCSGRCRCCCCWRLEQEDRFAQGQGVIHVFFVRLLLALVVVFDGI